MSFEPKFQGNARFEVRRQLGEGGMGAVYEVIDHDRGALVALKVLSRMSPLNVEQFKNEFRGLAGVVHPNLVRLHELIADGDHWSFTMDLVDGIPFIQYVRTDERESFTSLSAEAITRQQAVATIQGVGHVAPSPVRAGQLDVTRLRAVTSQLAAGIDAIHRSGKVHRDIKHSNVLVDSRGRVVILDFGLVADAATSSDAEAPGGVWGTPAYMSPEQAAGKVATAASDWYALGVMLYEAVTGRLPFAGKAQEVLLAKQRAEPVAPSTWVKNVPQDLEALCLQLLRFRAEDRPSGPEVLARLGVERVLPLTASLRPPFVGRAREVALLEAALKQSRDTPKVLFIEGLSGMGKSALADEVIARLRRDDPKWLVLAGRCYARESVPFKAFDGLIDALVQQLSTLSEMDLARLMPAGAHALTQMFPALLRVSPLKQVAAVEPLPADPKELRRRAFTCLRTLLSRMASERPVLVYTDDLQWGDEDSALLWVDLLSGEDAPALAWLSTFRSDERQSSPCLRTLLIDHRETFARATRVQLDALSAAEVGELAGSLVPRDRLDQHARDALIREADGNPYFAVELAREMRSQPPAERISEIRPVTLEQALSQRVGRLHRSARQLLRVIAVAAHPLDQKAAFRAAQLGYEGLSSLTELQSAQLVRLLGSDDHLVTAYHDRIRETVFDALAIEDVRDIHSALAAAFEQRGDADPELMTEHLVGAGELSRAARYAVRAAEQAARALAFERAARLYELALAHTTASAEEREAWRVALAQCLVNAGRGANAARVYFEAAAESSGRAAELRRLGAEQLILSGHIDEGIEVLGSVLRECGLSLPEPGQALVQTMELAARLRERGLAFTPCDARELSPAVALRLEVCWAVALGFTGSEPERLMPVVLQHLLDALDAGSAYHVLRALCLFIGNGAVATRPGSRTIAAALAAAEALVPLVNTPDSAAWVEQTKGMIAFLSHGDAPSALPLFERAESEFRERCRGVSREIGMAQVGVLASLCEQGRIAEYCRRYPAYLKDADERTDLYLTMYHRSYHAPLYYLAADDADRAWREIDVATQAWGRAAFDQCALFSLLSRLEVLLYRGGADAFRWAQEHGPMFLGSILATGHYFRLRFSSLRGRAAIAAANAGVDRSVALASAVSDLEEVERSELRVAPLFALSLRASLHAARDEHHEARAVLDKLSSTHGNGGNHMLASCAKLQQVLLATHATAVDQRRAPEAELRAESIANPTRWADMWLPIKAR